MNRATSTKEGFILTGRREPAEIADFYLERGAKLVVIKLGERGACFQTRAAGPECVPAGKVANVVDTVGAGDGCAVGVISGLLESLSVGEAVRRGNRIAGRVIRFVGDSEGLPNREQLT